MKFTVTTSGRNEIKIINAKTGCTHRQMAFRKEVRTIQLDGDTANIQIGDDQIYVINLEKAQTIRTIPI
jgi:hypothetical protein